MGFANRELETKLVLNGISLERAARLLSYRYPDDLEGSYTAGTSKDTYWNIPGRPDAFSRMRERDGLVQLTIKEEDNSDTANRLEIDIDSISSAEQISAYNTALYGSCIGTIHKFHHTFFLNKEHDESVCAYSIRVNGDPQDCIYVEVEARNHDTLSKHLDLVQDTFITYDVSGTRGSLWRMYFNVR